MVWLRHLRRRGAPPRRAAGGGARPGEAAAGLDGRPRPRPAGRAAPRGRRPARARRWSPRSSCQLSRSCATERGRPMATMREVAERAGVSAKTVSRVLRNDRYVSDDVRRRVNAAVQDLQYVPNMLAVTFRSGRDAAIGVAVPDIADPFFAQIVQAVEVEARARQTAVIVTSLGYDAGPGAGDRRGSPAAAGARPDLLPRLHRPVLPQAVAAADGDGLRRPRARAGSRPTASSRTTSAGRTSPRPTCSSTGTAASPSSATPTARPPRCSGSRATPVALARRRHRPWTRTSSTSARPTRPGSTGSCRRGPVSPTRPRPSSPRTPAPPWRSSPLSSGPEGDGLALVSFGDFPMAASLGALGDGHRPGPGRGRHVRGAAVLPPSRRAGEADAPTHGAARSRWSSGRRARCRVGRTVQGTAGDRSAESARGPSARRDHASRLRAGPALDDMPVLSLGASYMSSVTC